jgi:uncharacterized protein (DUF924 family)
MSSIDKLRLDPNLFNPDLYTQVHKVWFPSLSPEASAPSTELSKRWFGLGATAEEKDDVDSLCVSSFRSALESIGPERVVLPPFEGDASDEKHYKLISTPFLAQFYSEETKECDYDAALAVIVLLDQMPRNIFRESQGLIYGHYDRISRAVLSHVLDLKIDTRTNFQPPKQIWFYLPLMHSESLQEHEKYDQAMDAILQQYIKKGDKEAQEFLDRCIGIERKHREILEQFGRYPYRNTWMGRETTYEEKAWIDGGGETFGS